MIQKRQVETGIDTHIRHGHGWRKVILWVCGCIVSTGLRAQQVPDVCRDIVPLLKTMSSTHIRPAKTDTLLGTAFFTLFMERMDPEGLVLHPEDRAALLRTLEKSPDDPAVRACTFIQAFSTRYRQGLVTGDSLLAIIAEASLDYQQPEAWISYDNLPVPARYTAPQRWTQRVKFRLLRQYMDNQDSTRTLDLDTFLVAEPAMRAQLCQRMRCRIGRELSPPEGYEAYINNQFLQLISQGFDPHSLYFSVSDKKAFEAELSTEALSFGLVMGENASGEITIERMVPGGPAWKSHLLNEGDQVLSYRFEGRPKADLGCTSADELNALLVSEPGNQLQLEVRKSNGTREWVMLAREKMAVSDNIVNSFVLAGERKAGYIYLPGFYTDWQGEDALGCANDVATELLKLRMEKIEGLILDLRNNGGGSVQEALHLIGIFVDEGPLCIEKDPEGELSLLKDRNRGTAFDGPLIILVNGHSASASEILAGALQDYGRAVIVGDTTFGKSTGQVIVPLEGSRSSYVKVTTAQYFRLNGISSQQTGVIPDISLPEPGDPLMEREADEWYVLPADTVSKEIVYRRAATLPLASLAALSQTRLQTHRQFEEISRINVQLARLEADESPFPLMPLAFRDMYAGVYAIYDQLEGLDTYQATACEVTVPGFQQDILDLDTYRASANAEQLRDIQHDAHIEEAYRILLDLIRLTRP
ncbi:MAG: S41 family peptidase [Bacteroidia bacterium]|nr:S41 family peptidase [Bacteroidia bacterium]